MVRVLSQNGSPPPEFKTDADRNYLIVTIFPHESFAPGVAANDAENEGDGINDGINDGLNENGKEDRQAQIICIIKQNPKITVEQIAKRLCVSKSTVEREIKNMKEKNLIDHLGNNKTGYWDVIT